ncbi:hypothetical protein LSH36_115g13034 [Paralvinella palmiformis]|uniref:Uncharacterized protein n=1 Tax=Paralvinella palmiformis TaxID=53620 RepID=A0AAD9N905_9ANNE|nr:hypothetical protein LSH36_115g13034 [Paralvinella palmiformis]
MWTNKKYDGSGQLYLGWASSILNEANQSIRGLSELQNGRLLVTLVDILWPSARLGEKIQNLDDPTPEACMEVVLNYLTTIGVRHSLNEKDVIGEDLKPFCDLLWLIIINLSVHTPKLAPFQRNVRMGSRLMLNWCREKVPSMTVNHFESLVSNIQRDGVLIDLLKHLCVNITYHSDTQTYLENCLKAAEEELGVKKDIINAELFLQGKIGDEALLIYLTLLKRKIKQKEDLLALTSNKHELVGVQEPSHKLGMHAFLFFIVKHET